METGRFGQLSVHFLPVLPTFYVFFDLHGLMDALS